MSAQLEVQTIEGGEEIGANTLVTACMSLTE